VGEEKRLEVVGGKARGKEAGRKTRRMWMDNIRIDLLELG
jgi:hypothetical protein